MKVLVAYATKYGSTKSIADFIGEKLRQHGTEVDVLEVDAVHNPGDYDAFVIGSAVYMMRWLKEATEFVKQNSTILTNRPVCLFSSGPLGTSTKDAKGRDLIVVSAPKEIDVLKGVIKPRDHRVFFGALDSNKLGFAHRMTRRLPAAREALPEGDFRNWKEIEAWTSGIVGALENLPKVTQ